MRRQGPLGVVRLVPLVAVFPVVRLVPLVGVVRVVRLAVETVVTVGRRGTADRVRLVEIETIEIGRRARR